MGEKRASAARAGRAERADEYRSHLFVLVAAADAIRDIPIPELLDDIARAEAIGPLLDPALWIKKGDKMREDAELLRAALPLHEFAQKLTAMRQEASNG